MNCLSFTIWTVKRLNCTCGYCYALGKNWHLIFTSFKKHIRSGLKRRHKHWIFSFIYRTDAHKNTLTCRGYAASRYAQNSDNQTVANNVQDNKTTVWTPVTSEMIYPRPRSAFCDVTFKRQTYASGHDSKKYTWYSLSTSMGVDNLTDREKHGNESITDTHCINDLL